MSTYPATQRRGLLPIADRRTPTGIVVGIGAVVVVGATLLASMVPSADAGWRLAVVACAVGAFAAATTNVLAVPGTVALAWLFVNGFLVDRFGELSWHGAADVMRAVMLVLAGGVGQVVGHAWRLWLLFRRDRRFAYEWRALVHGFDGEETRDA